jgi:hypothetical protein
MWGEPEEDLLAGIPIDEDTDEWVWDNDPPA